MPHTTLKEHLTSPIECCNSDRAPQKHVGTAFSHSKKNLTVSGWIARSHPCFSPEFTGQLYESWHIFRPNAAMRTRRRPCLEFWWMSCTLSASRSVSHLGCMGRSDKFFGNRNPNHRQDLSGWLEDSLPHDPDIWRWGMGNSRQRGLKQVNPCTGRMLLHFALRSSSLEDSLRW